MTNQHQPTTSITRIMPLGVLIVWLLLLAIPVMAQEPVADGEFCVRAFNDLNGNGIRDLNEPPLQGGVSANLMDANGIIIASALLDNAPTATRGLICFQFLPAGQYTIEVTSGDYHPTTANVMSNVVQAGEIPYVMEFGGQSLDTGVITPTDTEDTTENSVMRIVLSLAGAIGAVIFMSFVGFLIYLIAYHGRLKRAPDNDAYYQRPIATETTEIQRHP